VRSRQGPCTQTASASEYYVAAGPSAGEARPAGPRSRLGRRRGCGPGVIPASSRRPVSERAGSEPAGVSAEPTRPTPPTRPTYMRHGTSTPFSMRSAIDKGSPWSGFSMGASISAALGRPVRKGCRAFDTRLRRPAFGTEAGQGAVSRRCWRGRKRSGRPPSPPNRPTRSFAPTGRRPIQTEVADFRIMAREDGPGRAVPGLPVRLRHRLPCRRCRTAGLPTQVIAADDRRVLRSGGYACNGRGFDPQCPRFDVIPACGHMATIERLPAFNSGACWSSCTAAGVAA
jgi:hypothetical protein